MKDYSKLDFWDYNTGMHHLESIEVVNSSKAINKIESWLDDNFTFIPRISVACLSGVYRSAAMARLLETRQLAICHEIDQTEDEKYNWNDWPGRRLISLNFWISDDKFFTKNFSKPIDGLLACYSAYDKDHIKLVEDLGRKVPVLGLVGSESQFIKFFSEIK